MNFRVLTYKFNTNVYHIDTQLQYHFSQETFDSKFGEALEDEDVSLQYSKGQCVDFLEVTDEGGDILYFLDINFDEDWNILDGDYIAEWIETQEETGFLDFTGEREFTLDDAQNVLEVEDSDSEIVKVVASRFGIARDVVTT